MHGALPRQADHPPGERLVVDAFPRRSNGSATWPTAREESPFSPGCCVRRPLPQIVGFLQLVWSGAHRVSGGSIAVRRSVFRYRAVMSCPVALKIST